MDNPAFGRTDGDPTVGDGSTESSDSATTVSTSDGDGDGEPSTTNGDGDGEPSTGDGDGEPNTGDGDGEPSCPLGSACSPCHVCDENGECVPDVGAPCAGAQLHCAEYLYGREGGTCYKLADVVLGSQCTEGGECKEVGANACPLQQGEPHFECDLGCVTFPEACEPFALAATVDLGNMCAVEGPGPECKPTCSNEMSSSIETYGCNFGECMSLGLITTCFNYACNEQTDACYQQCNDDAQCAVGHFCEQGICY